VVFPVSSAETKLERMARGPRFVDRVQQYLLSVPPKRMPEMASVARDLGLSARSLRRRLAAAGVSCKALVQSVLEIRATQMLSDPNRTIPGDRRRDGVLRSDGLSARLQALEGSDSWTVPGSETVTASRQNIDAGSQVALAVTGRRRR
jgi:hypothetical protein